MRRLLLSLLLSSATACTVVDSVALPSLPGVAGPEVFVTAGDITQPHEVIGLVQVHRAGVVLFGFVDVVGTDLETGFKEILMPEVRRLGGDGVVRVRYHMTQYTPWARAMGVVFFFIPLPSEVTITGQVVRLRAAAP